MLVFFLVSLFASALGALCGIGGGIVMRPVLDTLRLADVETISFLSGCAVLAMSAYSVAAGMLAQKKRGEKQTVPGMTPLAIGAAFGGVAGKLLFGILIARAADPALAGRAQALCVALMAVLTLACTLLRGRIKPRSLESRALCLLAGFAMGALSGFLGIGGGPVNLIVLFFFFGMDTKPAARASLYIIFFSQGASLLYTLLTRSVPEFLPAALALMVLGGIAGGMAGRWIHKRISGKIAGRLLVGLMALILALSVYSAAIS